MEHHLHGEPAILTISSTSCCGCLVLTLLYAMLELIRAALMIYLSRINGYSFNGIIHQIISYLINFNSLVIRWRLSFDGRYIGWLHHVQCPRLIISNFICRAAFAL